MGLNLITVLEIFTNPKDLFISIAPEEQGGKLGYVISRGPGHDFKLLIDETPWSYNLDEVVTKIESVLESVQTTARKELEDKTSPIAQVIYTGSEAIDESLVLNSDLIDEISGQLRARQTASTYNMNQVA